MPAVFLVPTAWWGLCMTSTLLRLLAAARGNPEDDGPRLVLADWLEEQGDPRGEFVRLECRLEAMEDGDPQYPVFRPRSDELAERYGEAWLAPVKAVGQGFSSERGL